LISSFYTSKDFVVDLTGAFFKAMNAFLDFIEKDDEGGRVKAKLIKWLCSEAEKRLNRFFETDSSSTALMLRLWKILKYCLLFCFIYYYLPTN